VTEATITHRAVLGNAIAPLVIAKWEGGIEEYSTIEQAAQKT
jgi:Na+/H+-dicarboxylate symporter